MLPLFFMSFKALISKWCNDGVVSTFPVAETLVLQGFRSLFQDIAMADKQDLGQFFHVATSSFPVFCHQYSIGEKNLHDKLTEISTDPIMKRS